MQPVTCQTLTIPVVPTSPQPAASTNVISTSGFSGSNSQSNTVAVSPRSVTAASAITPTSAPTGPPVISPVPSPSFGNTTLPTATVSPAIQTTPVVPTTPGAITTPVSPITAAPSSSNVPPPMTTAPPEDFFHISLVPRGGSNLTITSTYTPVPAPSGYFPNYGYGNTPPPSKEKRQSGSYIGYVGPEFYTESNCAAATAFHIDDGLLYDEEGYCFSFTFGPGTPYLPFEIPSTEGSMDTQWFIDEYGILYFENEIFNYGGGFAYFCQLDYPYGQVQVLADGPFNAGYPPNCTPVNLAVIWGK